MSPWAARAQSDIRSPLTQIPSNMKATDHPIALGRETLS
jgi:hypothetical protein